MGGIKVEQKTELNSDHVEWLRAMAEKYGLFGTDKALRVVLDYAMESQDESGIFEEVRCNHCRDNINQD